MQLLNFLKTKKNDEIIFLYITILILILKLIFQY